MKFKAKKRVILSDFEPFLTLKFAKKMFSRAILPYRAVAKYAAQQQKGFRNFFAESLSVSINLSTRWQTLKKEGKSVRRALVGVQRYVRERAGRKQAKPLKFRGFEGDTNK